MRPKHEVVPALYIRDVAGAVRSLLTVDDGVVVATRTGILRGVPLPDDLTNISMAKVLCGQLECGLELGLAKSVAPHGPD